MSDQARILSLETEIARLRQRNSELEQLLATAHSPVALPPMNRPDVDVEPSTDTPGSSEAATPEPADLSQALQQLQQEKTARTVAETRLNLFEALVENALDGIGVATLDGTITYGNPAFKTLTGFGDRTVGSAMGEYFDADDLARVAQEVVPAVVEQGHYQGRLRYRRPDGSHFLGQISAFVLRDATNTPTGQAVIVRDVTAQQQAEEERLALQEEIIVTQQAVLRELMTPLLPIAEGVVVMPVVGNVDSARTQQIMETLLEGIAVQQAGRVILDITGVKVVDTQVANALIRAAQASQLLGAQVILTGIGPEVAQTLVHLAADLQGIVTRSTLQSGIAYALDRTM
ncbi:MAG: PAS domain S-box protein [Chloroflexaceae bacterium]